jgi:hypothetical protein
VIPGTDPGPQPLVNDHSGIVALNYIR